MTLIEARDSFDVNEVQQFIGANLTFGVFDWGGTPSQLGSRPSSDDFDVLSPEIIDFFTSQYLPDKAFKIEEIQKFLPCMQISLNYQMRCSVLAQLIIFLMTLFSWRIDGKQQAMTVSLLSTPEYPTLSLCSLRISWSYFLRSVIAGLREFSLNKLTRRRSNFREAFYIA